MFGALDIPNPYSQTTGPPRQATGPPRSGAGVGVGMLRGVLVSCFVFWFSVYGFRFCGLMVLPFHGCCVFSGCMGFTKFTSHVFRDVLISYPCFSIFSTHLFGASRTLSNKLSSEFLKFTKIILL